LEALVSEELLKKIVGIIFNATILSERPSDEQFSTEKSPTDFSKKHIHLLRFLIIVAKSSTSRGLFLLEEANLVNLIHETFTGKPILDSDEEFCDRNIFDVISQKSGICVELLSLIDEVLPKVPCHSVVSLKKKSDTSSDMDIEVDTNFTTAHHVNGPKQRVPCQSQGDHTNLLAENTELSKQCNTVTYYIRHRQF
jgi:hypothetical protein